MKTIQADRTRSRTPESKAFHQDIKLRDKHVEDAKKAFKVLWKDLEPYADAAKEAFPDRDQVSLKRRKSHFVSVVKDLPEVVNYLDTWIGDVRDDPRAKSWRAAIVYQLRNVYFDSKVTLGDAIREVEKKATLGFYALAMSESQAPLREAIPESLRSYLPQRIVVDIDENGAIKRVTDRFNNEFETLALKIKRQKTLIQRYNVIAKKVKTDLKSKNEMLRLSALLTAIIMETGIRPGRIGATMTKDGQEIETFGAITLGPQHVKFIRANFARLEFVGKKGTTNLAAVSDQEILKLLEEYVVKASKAGAKSIFVTEKGEPYTYSNLQSYFRGTLLRAFKPTDFRKLKATEKVFEGIKARQQSLYKEIQETVDQGAEDAKEKVVEAVSKVVEQAYEDARAALSHETVQVTISAYINPVVLLRFLSQGGVEKSLQEAVVNNQTMLRFDPLVFIEKATGKKLARQAFEAWAPLTKTGGGGGMTLKQLLENLEDPDDPTLKLGAGGDLSIPVLPWSAMAIGFPDPGLKRWTLKDARTISGLLDQGWTPDDILGAPQWRKLSLTVNDINDIRTMSQRGMLMKRRAFNKYNAPELMGQLMRVLADNGLDDAVNQLKMKKVPQLVDRAWSQRGVTASDESLRKDLIRVAFENPGPVQDAILPLLKRRTAGIDLPGMDVRAIAGLRRVVDDNTYKLLREIYRTLQGRFDQNDEMAMNRVLASIKAGSSWDEALHRNNIFKAADLLKIKLPHYMF